MIIEKMAGDLGLPAKYIVGIANGALHEYKTYHIRKKSGGWRVIHHPSRKLKGLQRWLLSYVVESLPVHPSATAYRKGTSILDNARAHCGSEFLLRMDLENFFPSITQTDLAKYIAKNPTHFAQWAASDIDVFLRLVCRGEALTIGAPTSPSLSNAVCYELDVALYGLSEKHGVRYTRYADDLFFSTTTPNILKVIEKEVDNVISSIELPGALKVNKAKTRHSSKRGARRVTGIVLGSDGNTYIGRALKRTIRARIHTYDTLTFEEKRTLAGLISFATGLDPDFMNSLIAKYGPARVKIAATMPLYPVAA